MTSNREKQQRQKKSHGKANQHFCKQNNRFITKTIKQTTPPHWLPAMVIVTLSKGKQTYIPTPREVKTNWKWRLGRKRWGWDKNLDFYFFRSVWKNQRKNEWMNGWVNELVNDIVKKDNNNNNKKFLFVFVVFFLIMAFCNCVLLSPGHKGTMYQDFISLCYSFFPLFLFLLVGLFIRRLLCYSIYY